MISIHAPLAGGDSGRGLYRHERGISIHAPLAGGDLVYVDSLPIQKNFNPRPPRGGRRGGSGGGIGGRAVFQSTPPSRGATFSRKSSPSPSGYFNPRPPRGGDGGSSAIRNMRSYFNPRPPRGGRRGTLPPTEWSRHISIHAPLAGGDREMMRSKYASITISIHAPLAGGDAGAGGGGQARPHFNPRPPRGGRQQKSPNNMTVFAKNKRFSQILS